MELQLIVLSVRLLGLTRLGFWVMCLHRALPQPYAFVLYKNEDVFVGFVFTANDICLKCAPVSGILIVILSAKFLY